MDKCVYQLRLLTSDLPFYVGKGSLRRPKQHFLPCERNVKSHKNNVINKALREDVEVLIEYIFTGLSDQEALETEKTVIALYGRENLTNATDGGDGLAGLERTETHKRKIADSHRYTLQSVLDKFKDAHGERYDYSMIHEYSGCYDKVPIICPSHGIFYQYPQNHWQGRACHKCAQVSRTKSKTGQRRTEEQKLRASIGRKGIKPNMPKASCVICRKEMPANVFHRHKH